MAKKAFPIKKKPSPPGGANGVHFTTCELQRLLHKCVGATLEEIPERFITLLRGKLRTKEGSWVEPGGYWGNRVSWRGWPTSDIPDKFETRVGSYDGNLGLFLTNVPAVPRAKAEAKWEAYREKLAEWEKWYEENKDKVDAELARRAQAAKDKKVAAAKKKRDQLKDQLKEANVALEKAEAIAV